MPKEDIADRHRREAEAEAARRGVTVAEYLRSLGVHMVSLHARVRSGLMEDIDAEGKAREMTRAEVIRDRLERSPAWKPGKAGRS